MDTHATGLEILRRDNRWPAEKPDFPATSWGWGIDGEKLLLSRLPDDARCILEIGTLLGASTRFFADARPHATVICIDPWNDVKNRPLLRHQPELAPYLNDRRDGLYNVFLSSTWDYRERVIPLRGYSPERIRDVYDAGLKPDFVYVDGSHEYEDVLVDFTTCHLLFENAVLSGDDWNWDSVSRAVRRFAQLRGLEIATEGNTFALEETAASERIEMLPPSQSVPPRQRGIRRLLGSLTEFFTRP